MSIGSVGEMLWAGLFRKPVILAREVRHNPHHHGLTNTIAACAFEEFDPATDNIIATLS